MWSADKFSRRRYAVEGPSLDAAKKIEIIVKVDGEMIVHVQAREPGLVAFVSRPSDQGFEIDVVEVKQESYRDRAVPDVYDGDIEDWQRAALGL